MSSFFIYYVFIPTKYPKPERGINDENDQYNEVGTCWNKRNQDLPEVSDLLHH